MTDTCRGLQWEQKTTPHDSGANLSDPHDVDNLYTWSATAGGTAADGTAFTGFLVKLNTPPCLAGLCGWCRDDGGFLQCYDDPGLGTGGRGGFGKAVAFAGEALAIGAPPRSSHPR